MSELLAPYEFPLAVLDEGQSVELSSVYAVTCCIGTLLMFWDEAQSMEQLRYGNAMTANVHRRTSEGYSWQKAVTGGVFVHVWEFMEDSDIYRVPVTWRFGEAVCGLLSLIAKAYERPDRGIFSPGESCMKTVLEAEQRRQVPDTKLRFVFYENMQFYGTQRRGVLEDTAYYLGDHIDASKRVGA